MRLPLLLAALLVAICSPPPCAHASIQARMLCWEPDIEFPVPCDPDEE
jgi:hypothetical protein